ncbi:hypothetical protein TRFO_25507 [Tritrichomonas foetus]|uniref:Spindle assembly abnormal protein 6 N-terminal domain-containing protein n=1 Tax=Tritrichomonas foetus TaxID=1144522 RepID=A0A1J4K506_9EUKA|nr:hypothetical protein TRFO_25507 [Tritrichomonas foetus]|eukprot:OHT06479.1 hypothetical protein TRFO_25507 [Tritrichomonas foetus]
MSFVQEGLLDPSTQDGGKVFFDKEIPLEIKPESEEEENEVFLTRVKIILHENESTGQLENVHLELTTDVDLFFFYEASYNEESYNVLKENQRLEITFDQFPELMKEVLEQYASNSDEYFVTFDRKSDDCCSMLFQQRLRFKCVDIFELEFSPASNDYVHDQIQYRFNLARAEVKSARTELSDLYALLKIKNPNVLKQMRPRK